MKKIQWPKLRKRMEEALANERNVLRTLIDILPDNIFIKDAESRFVISNLAHARLLRAKTPDEIVGKTDYDIFPQELASRYYADEQAVIQSGQPLLNREERTIDPEGKTRWLLTTKVPLRDEHGKVIGVAGINRDITERKRMEEELKRYSTNLEQLIAERTRKLVESERRFRELAELLPQVVFEIDDEGNLTFLNHVGFSSTGYGEDDLRRGLSAFQMFLPEDHDRAKQKIRMLLGGEKVSHDEYAVLRKDGSTFPAIVYAAAVMREDRAVGVRGIVVDITERKRMEQKLRDSEERFRGIAERSIDGIFEMDLEGRVTYVSPSVVPALGYKPEEVIGTHIERYLPESEFPKITPNMAALMKGMNVLGLQGEMLRKDGTHVPAEMNASPIFRDGRIVGVQGIIRDITERKRMEEELRSTKERLEYVVRSNPAVIYSGKPFADLSDWELTYLSENVTNLLGYEAREFVGHPEFWTHVVHPVDRPSVLRQMPRLWEKGRFIFEYRMRHKDGDYRWIREEANAIRDVEGKPVDVTGYWIDITELKRLEETLLNSQRLAAIGETAMMVGHDLRNPLQSMTGTLYVARKLATSEEVEDRKEAVGLLGTLDDAIQYMDKIVSDLQDYARPIGADLVETSLPHLIRDSVSSVRIPRNVEVAVNIGDGLSNVKLDPLLFRRVLNNLILNAVQAMPKGGRLTITGSKEGKSLTVTVHDTGVGVAPENLGKVFNPFFTTKAKGQGLGLAVCKRLVEAQAGTINVSSEVGKGSTFTVTVPASRAQVEA